MAEDDNPQLVRLSLKLGAISTTESGNQSINITGCTAEAGGTLNIILNQALVSADLRNNRGVVPSIIKHFKSDHSNLFVSTEGFDASENTLLDHRALMIIGAPGSGKTMIAQQLMVRLWDIRKCHPFRPTKPSDYSKNCNTGIPQVFHIDDAFGSTTFDKSKYDGWLSVVGNMREDLRSQNTYIIFTSRDNIWNENSSDQKNYDIFSHVINLSADKFKLTEMNKIDIFDNHARVNEVGIDYKDIVKPKQAKDDSDQIKEEPMGYPQRARLCCSMKDVTKEARIRYFRRPMEFLSNIIASYREKHHLSYCVLVLLLVNDGNLPKSFFHQCNMSSEQVQKCMDICRLSASTTTMGHLLVTAEHLCGSFLILNDDCFVAQHESIMEAAALDFGKNNPTDILDHCSIQFLLERVFTNDSAPLDNEYVVLLPEAIFPQLCARLIKEITGCLFGKSGVSSEPADPIILRSISAYRVFRDPAFFRVFLRRLQQTESFHLLLSSSSADSQHPTFLFLAAVSGQDMLLHEVLDSYSHDLCQLLGFSDHLDRILYAACFGGSSAAVRELLAAGARTDYRRAHQPRDVRFGRWKLRPTYSTTLMHAAYYGSVEVLRLLQDSLNMKEHVDVRDEWDMTALLWWAEGGSGVAALQFLLDAGADINARDKVGQTALHWRAGEDDEAAVRALLLGGADVDLRRDDSQTELVQIREELDEIRMKAIPYVGDEFGPTALHISAENGQKDIVQLLVAAGADIHLRVSAPSWYSDAGYLPYANKTTLEVAVLYKHTAVADFLRSLPSK